MDRIKCMRVFLQVANASSFARAARELHVSAATVTKHVSALESELGVRLLERTTRQVQLTEAGRFYLERCGETLQALDDTEAAMSQLSRAPSGVLRATAPLDTSGDLALVIARYMKDYPEVTVDLRLANHNIDLINEGFDLGVGLMSPSHASYVSRKLCTTTIAAIASPAYLEAHGHPRTPTDLARHRNVVFVEPQPRTEWTFRKGNRAVQVQLAPAMMTNSGKALLDLAVEGAGISLAPSMLFGRELASGRIVRILTDYHIGSFGLHVRYPSRRFLPAKVRCFVEALRQYFGDDPDADFWWPHQS